jgi:lipoyl(octanoyl) transferase
MRVDRQLWRSCEVGDRTSPFLRVYGWSPPALSLGFHQAITPIVAGRAKAQSLEVVRRPTGGAAVLHDEEITYAVVAPLGMAGLGRRTHEIYDAIAAAIVRALADLGVRCDRGGGGRPEGFACFSAAGGHEITVDRRKLVGSALRRGRHAFLQHGSLLTGPKHLGIAELMEEDCDVATATRAALSARTTDLSQVEGGQRVTAETFGAALAAALARRIDPATQ